MQGLEQLGKCSTLSYAPSPETESCLFRRSDTERQRDREKRRERREGGERQKASSSEEEWTKRDRGTERERKREGDGVGMGRSCLLKGRGNQVTGQASKNHWVYWLILKYY